MGVVVPKTCTYACMRQKHHNPVGTIPPHPVGTISLLQVGGCRNTDRDYPVDNPDRDVSKHPVGVFLDNPVGTTISSYISYYRPGLFSFDKTSPDRDILVRENSPDRVSFVSFPPTLSPSARGRHPSYHASPTSTLRRLHFATLYISGTGSFSDLRMHTTSNTGRVICVT